VLAGARESCLQQHAGMASLAGSFLTRCGVIVAHDRLPLTGGSTTGLSATDAWAKPLPVMFRI